ncbi:MAG TPA: hypothetical protein VFS67_02595 [Polyangiaceae bacterium]|nr:hypothetical protein [Polyangiaceae bacterium]
MLGAATSLLLAAFSASVIEGAIGADSEVAVGRAPVDYSGPSEDSITFTLVPGLAIRNRTPDSTLTLSYTPRIFYRLPNALHVNHPLVLHQVALDHTLDIGKWLAWTTTATLAIGEIDYTAAGVVFDPTLASAVTTSVTDILRTTANTGLKYLVRPTLSLNLEGGVEYTTTLDKTNVVPIPPSADGTLPAGTGLTQWGSVIPDSFQARGKPGFAISIGKASHAGASAEVTYQWFRRTARYLVLSPELDWDTKFGERTTLGVAGGVAYVWTLDAVPPQPKKNSLGGTGNIDVKSIVYKGPGLMTTLDFNAALDWYFDPILGTSTPRSGATATGVFQAGKRWTISPLASFYTNLKNTRYRLIAADGTALPSDDPAVIQQQQQAREITPDSTLLRFELPFDYRIDDGVSFGFGARTLLRSRPIPDPDFKIGEQVEFWIFAGLTVRAATSVDHGSWLPL